MRSIGSARTTRPRLGIGAALVTMLIASRTPSAIAGQYPARGDTGWIHTSKRECCNDAIARAQEASALACDTAGGSPAPPRGGVQRRGSCAWESAVDDDGITVFRCQADASIWCR